MNILIAYPSTMVKKKEIRRFNMINLQNGSDKDIPLKIQRILYYAESRFWCILKSLKNDDKRHTWCQKLLHRELVN